MTGQCHCIKVGDRCRTDQPDRRQNDVLEQDGQIQHHDKDSDKRSGTGKILSNRATAAGDGLFQFDHVGVLLSDHAAGGLHFVDPLFSNLEQNVKNFLGTFVNKPEHYYLTH